MSQKIYTPEEAARKVLEKCQELYDMSKSESLQKMSVEEAVDKILHDKWEVQDVLDKVPEDKRDDVLSKLRELKQDKDYPHQSVHGFDKKGMDKSEDMSKKQGVPEGVDPDKMEDCVKQVKGKDNVDSPYAVCSASLQGETKKSEMDKCGEMKQISKEESKGKALKDFMEKRKSKKTAKMEKIMGIGETSKPKPPIQAQGTMPVQAPKPTVAAPVTKKKGY